MQLNFLIDNNISFSYLSNRTSIPKNKIISYFKGIDSLSDNELELLIKCINQIKKEKEKIKNYKIILLISMIILIILSIVGSVLVWNDGTGIMGFIPLYFTRFMEDISLSILFHASWINIVIYSVIIIKMDRKYKDEN